MKYRHRSSAHLLFLRSEKRLLFFSGCLLFFKVCYLIRMVICPLVISRCLLLVRVVICLLTNKESFLLVISRCYIVIWMPFHPFCCHFWDPLWPFGTIFGHIAAIFLKFDGHCCNFLSFSATLKAKKEHLVVGILKKRSIRPSFWDYGHFADTLLSILSCNLIQGPPTHVTMVFFWIWYCSHF